jgi:hypothetical protein
MLDELDLADVAVATSMLDHLASIADREIQATITVEHAELPGVRFRCQIPRDLKETARLLDAAAKREKKSRMELEEYSVNRWTLAHCVQLIEVEKEGAWSTVTDDAGISQTFGSGALKARLGNAGMSAADAVYALIKDDGIIAGFVRKIMRATTFGSEANEDPTTAH